MIEREVKIKVCCEETIRIMNVLKNMDARVLGKYREVDIYLNHPCRDFSKTDEALRIRVFNGKDLCELTYKGPRIRSDERIKVREEVTIKVLRSDVENLIRLLKKLGFKEVAKVVKERAEFQVGEAKIALDKVEKLGCFIEIEFPEKAYLERVLEMLNIKGEFIEKTYLEMVLNL